MATKRSQSAGGAGATATAGKAARARTGGKARADGVAGEVTSAAAPEATETATETAHISAISERDAAATVAAATLTPTPAPAAAPAKKPGVERRRSVREKCVAPAVLQPPSGDASAEAAHGVTVQDLSLGGVGFRATEKFAPGETYRITLGKGPLLLNARVKIVSCRQVGHRQYHVGAEFC